MRWFHTLLAAMAMPLTIAQWEPPPTPTLPGHYVPFSELSSCQTLQNRARPTLASDVRPDDFTTVIALGDSITAAFLAKTTGSDLDINGDTRQSLLRPPSNRIRIQKPFVLYFVSHLVKPDTSSSEEMKDYLAKDSQSGRSHRRILPFILEEDRGVSYAAGGDPDQITIPNLISHFSPSSIGSGRLNGSSTGSHPVVACLGPLCLHPENDGLNGALSGSLSSGLLSQVRDYIVPKMKDMEVPEDDWKYVNLGIGANDICAFCLSPNTSSLPTAGSPEDFANGIKLAVEYLRDHVPNVIVNIIGLFKVSEIYALTLKDPYCSTLPLIPHLPLECSCAMIPGPAGDWTRRKMDDLGEAYDRAVRQVIKAWGQEAEWISSAPEDVCEDDVVDDDYVGTTDEEGEERVVYQQKRRTGYNRDGFGVTWQPGNVVDLAHYPIIALSPVDCFHPSIHAHQRMAAGIWNRLTLPMVDRAIPISWEDEVWVRCLEEDDRIRLWLE